MIVPRRIQTISSEKWLSVREASALIGISPATLRRWSVAGDVAAFTTPGGHRRFARSAILMLLESSSEKSSSPKRSTIAPTHLNRVYRQKLETLSQRQVWLNESENGAGGLLSEQGSRISSSLMRYMDANDPQERRSAIRDARDAAVEFGQRAARSSLQICQTVQVFLVFRMLFLGDIFESSLSSRRSKFEATHMLVMATEAFDELLISLMEAHESETVRMGSGG